MFLPEQSQPTPTGVTEFTPSSPATTQDDVLLMQRVFQAAAANPLMLPSDFMAYLLDYIQTSRLTIPIGQVFGYTKEAVGSARLLISTPPQSIANGVSSAIAFLQAYDWDTSSAAFGTRGGVTTGFQVSAGGIYRADAYCSYAASAVGVRYTSLRVNGIAIDHAADVRSAPSSLLCDVTIGNVFQLSSGDYIEVYVYQTSGGALDVVDAHLSLTKVQ